MKSAALNIPQFSLRAEALMAALASRSHEWNYWEIEEQILVSLDSEGKSVAIAEQNLCLRVEQKDGSAAQITLPTDAASPFEAVDIVLSAKTASKKAVLLAQNRDWNQSDSTLLAFYTTANSEIETESLIKQLKTTSNAEVTFKRLKNSLGYATDHLRL